MSAEEPSKKIEEKFSERAHASDRLRIL